MALRMLSVDPSVRYSITDTTSVEPTVHKPCADNTDPRREYERKLKEEPILRKRSTLLTEPAPLEDRSEKADPMLTVSNVE
jgi:hypothetical protein